MTLSKPYDELVMHEGLLFTGSVADNISCGDDTYSNSQIVDAARQHADTVAERASAIGVAADARASTVAAQTGLPQLPAGWSTDDTVVAHFVDAYAKLIGRMRDRVERAGQIDLISQDLLIQITADLEKQSWMLQAEQPVSGLTG